MKIAYFGYDFFFSCFELLVEQGHEILSVHSFECDNEYDFNLRLEAAAEKLGIPFLVEKPTQDDIEQLYAKGCELVIAAAYPYKIPELPNVLYAVNIHPSLLPEGKGRWPLPWIVLKELKESGVTIHKLSQEWDSGDVLIQKKFKIFEDDNLETISAKSQIATKEALSELLTDFESYWKNAQPQHGGSQWPFPSASDRSIVWDRSYKEIDKIVRAFGKFESYAKFDGKKWLVQDATCWPEIHGHVPGTVVHRTDREVVIACKDGFVCLRRFSEDLDSRVP